jgi:HPt (histidine-containing phosphotransfer) domain-containing protein
VDERLHHAGPVAPAGSTDDGVIDPDQFDSLLRLADARGDPTFLPTLVGHFLDQAATYLTELREAAAKGDVVEVMQVAHRLKGSSATMGAARVASVCEELEQAARGGAQTDPAAVDVVAVALEQTAAAYRMLVPPA